MRYLSNIDPEDEGKALEAIRRSGQDIEIHRHPMPRQDHSIDWGRYDPTCPHIQHYLSLCLMSGDDASSFWEAWRYLSRAE